MTCVECDVQNKFNLLQRGPFYYNGLTLILAWMNNHMLSEVWDEITHPFPNVKGAVEVWG